MHLLTFVELQLNVAVSPAETLVRFTEKVRPGVPVIELLGAAAAGVWPRSAARPSITANTGNCLKDRMFLSPRWLSRAEPFQRVQERNVRCFCLGLLRRPSGKHGMTITHWNDGGAFGAYAALSGSRKD